MPTKKTTGTDAKQKASAGKKRSPRKRAIQVMAAAAGAAPATTAAPPAGDRLTEVAKTIGSTVGEIVAKTKHALHRG